MVLKRMALEIGMGTDIRGADSTKAAQRALRDALWRNTLSIAQVCGKYREDMDIAVHIGVPRPETVRHDDVLSVLPYGQATLQVVDGGLEIPTDDGSDSTLIAHAAAVVSLDLD
ncbi:MAG: Lin0512 family protein [Hyphomicrobiaceae bacterium]